MYRLLINRGCGYHVVIVIRARSGPIIGTPRWRKVGCGYLAWRRRIMGNYPCIYRSTHLTPTWRLSSLKLVVKLIYLIWNGDYIPRRAIGRKRQVSLKVNRVPLERGRNKTSAACRVVRQLMWTKLGSPWSHLISLVNLKLLFTIDVAAYPFAKPESTSWPYNRNPEPSELHDVKALCMASRGEGSSNVFDSSDTPSDNFVEIP